MRPACSSSVAKMWAASGLAAGSEASYDDEPVRPEHLFEHAAEGLGGAQSRSVRTAGDVLNPRCELGRWQCRTERVHGARDACGPCERADRVRAGPVRRGRLDDAQRQLGVEDGRRADLVPVVILRVDPEDRDGARPVLPLDAGREPDGGDRLEEREQRSTEEPGLLASDDRHRRRVSERTRACTCLGGRAAARLLRVEKSAQRPHDRARATACGRSRRPRRRGRRDRR